MLYAGFDVQEMNPTSRVLKQEKVTKEEAISLLSMTYTSRCSPRFKKHVEVLRGHGIELSIDETPRILYLKPGDSYLLIIPPEQGEEYQFELHSAR